MRFRTRRLVKSEDLNPRGTLFGGRMLQWIDEEAAIYAFCQLGSQNVVTKYMSEINFVSPANVGDIVEIGIDMVNIGRTSLTFECEVRNKMSKQTIIKIDKIVFVSVDENGKSIAHGLTEKKQDEENI
jgi:acyl-CoA thioesterase YciA